MCKKNPGFFKFSNNLAMPQNSMHQKDDMKNFHIENPQLLCATIQNIVAQTSWHLQLVHPHQNHICKCFKLMSLIRPLLRALLTLRKCTVPVEFWNCMCSCLTNIGRHIRGRILDC